MPRYPLSVYQCHDASLRFPRTQDPLLKKAIDGEINVYLVMNTKVNPECELNLNWQNEIDAAVFFQLRSVTCLRSRTLKAEIDIEKKIGTEM